jgi:hypothetical protein
MTKKEDTKKNSEANKKKALGFTRSYKIRRWIWNYDMANPSKAIMCSTSIKRSPCIWGKREDFSAGRQPLMFLNGLKGLKTKELKALYVLCIQRSFNIMNG